MLTVSPNVFKPIHAVILSLELPILVFPNFSGQAETTWASFLNIAAAAVLVAAIGSLFMRPKKTSEPQNPRQALAHERSRKRHGNFLFHRIGTELDVIRGRQAVFGQTFQIAADGVANHGAGLIESVAFSQAKPDR